MGPVIIPRRSARRPASQFASPSPVRRTRAVASRSSSRRSTSGDLPLNHTGGHCRVHDAGIRERGIHLRHGHDAGSIMAGSLCRKNVRSRREPPRGDREQCDSTNRQPGQFAINGVLPSADTRDDSQRPDRGVYTYQDTFVPPRARRRCGRAWKSRVRSSSRGPSEDLVNAMITPRRVVYRALRVGPELRVTRFFSSPGSSTPRDAHALVRSCARYAGEE